MVLVGIFDALRLLLNVTDEIMPIQLNELQKATRTIQTICSEAKVQLTSNSVHHVHYHKFYATCLQQYLNPA